MARKTSPQGDTTVQSDRVEELLLAGYRYALALTQHPQDAEDLVQQGWLQHLATYGKTPGLSLLFTIIRNLYLDQVQRKGRIAFQSLDDGGEVLPPRELPEPGANDPEQRIDMERLLAGLRSEEREVLFLHYVHGYTVTEMSELTERPRGSVLSLLHRSRKKLRRAFDDGARSTVQNHLQSNVAFNR